MKRVVASCFSAYIIAMLAASYLPPVTLLPLAAIFVLLGVVAFHKNEKNATIIALFLLLGLLVQWVSTQWLAKPVFAMENTTQTLTVQVVEIQSGYVEGFCNAELEVLAVEGESVPYARRFYLQCSLFPATELGTIYTGNFDLSAIKKDNYYYSNMADRIWLRATVNEVLRQTGKSTGFSIRMKMLQQTLAKNITSYISANEAGVLAAMSVGWKGSLRPQIIANYRDAGVSHILVVSGLHLGILCSVLPGKRAIGWRRKMYAIVALAMVLFVMALTGFTPSVCRAGVAAIIVYCGMLLRLPPDAATSLAIAGMVASFGGPYALCDVGLQLSFMATIGIMCAHQWLESSTIKEKESWLASKAYTIYKVTILSSFACVFTLPVLFANNLAISLWTPVSNLLTTLLVAPTVVLGMLAAVCGLSGRLEFWRNVFLLLGGLLAKAMNAIVATIASLPGAGVQVDGGYMLLIWLVVASLVAVFVWLKLGKWLRVAVPAVLCVAFVCYASFSQNLVTMTTLGTAGNQCLVVQQNEQIAVVFRGGTKNEKVVLEFLQNENIEAVDLLVDLRQNASEVTIPAQKLIVVSEQTLQTNTEMCDIMISTLHFGEGNLAVVDVQGYKVSVSTGKIVATQPFITDVHLASNSPQEGIQAQTLVAASQADWHSHATETIYYGSETTLLLRPGKAVKLKGGNYGS